MPRRWRPGPIRAGSRTAAPASWRPRTRWPPSALGAQHGYRMFECDVKLTADGVPFLLHDATLRAHHQRPRPSPATCPGASWRGSMPAAGTAAPTPASRWPRSRRGARSAWRTATRSTSRSSRRPGREAETGRVVAEQAARLWRRRRAAAAPQLVPAGRARRARRPRRRTAARPAARQPARRLARRSPGARLRRRRHRAIR